MKKKASDTPNKARTRTGAASHSTDRGARSRSALPGSARTNSPGTGSTGTAAGMRRSAGIPALPAEAGSPAVILPLAAGFILLALARLAAVWAPDARLWGLNHLAFLPGWQVAVFTVLAVCAVLPQSARLIAHAGAVAFGEGRQRTWLATLVMTAAAVGFWMLPMETYFLGDGAVYLAEHFRYVRGLPVSTDVLYSRGSAPLTGWILAQIASIAHGFSSGDPASLLGDPRFAFRIASLIAGTAFAGLAWSAARTFWPRTLSVSAAARRTQSGRGNQSGAASPRSGNDAHRSDAHRNDARRGGAGRLDDSTLVTARMGTFLLLASGAGSLFFFGYVEYYTFVFTALAWHMIALDRAARGEIGLLTPILSLALAVAFHFLALVALPALLVVAAGRASRAGLRRLAAPRVVAGTIAAILAAAGIWYFASGVASAGSRVILSLAPYGSEGRMQYYTLLSTMHLADIVNEILLLAGPALLALIIVRPRAQGLAVRAAAVNAVFLFFLAFFGNTAFGLARDWDIVAVLGVAVSILVIAALRAGMGEADAALADAASADAASADAVSADAVSADAVSADAVSADADVEAVRADSDTAALARKADSDTAALARKADSELDAERVDLRFDSAGAPSTQAAPVRKEFADASVPAAGHLRPVLVLVLAGAASLTSFLPWLAVNVQPSASVSRFASILALDDRNIMGDYALNGYEHLRKYYQSTADFTGEAWAIRKKIECVGYPADYRKLALALVSSPAASAPFGGSRRDAFTWLLGDIAARLERMQKVRVDSLYAGTRAAYAELAAETLLQCHALPASDGIDAAWIDMWISRFESLAGATPAFALARAQMAWDRTGVIADPSPFLAAAAGLRTSATLCFFSGRALLSIKLIIPAREALARAVALDDSFTLPLVYLAAAEYELSPANAATAIAHLERFLAHPEGRRLPAGSTENARLEGYARTLLAHIQTPASAIH